MKPSLALFVKEVTDRIDVVGQGMDGREYREFLDELRKAIGKRFTIYTQARKDSHDACHQ